MTDPFAKYDFQILNAQRVGNANLPDFDTYQGWKSRGKQVKKGAKQRSIRVREGGFRDTDPITGEDCWIPRYVTAFGFGADQVY
jgi:hypothetical protein